MLDLYLNDRTETQVGLDEVGRGCFAGPVVAGAVIWDSAWLDAHKGVYKEIERIKDSKKVSKKRRKECEIFIKTYAKAYSISFVESTTIDELNILNATNIAMHKCLDELSHVHIDRILVDGNYFKPYVARNASQHAFIVPHTCIPNGDNKYISIASASILAKVARDEYIEGICDECPVYDERYDWKNNKGYGTKKHIDGIKKWGLSEYHRCTFGICRSY
jgi:ribonuclease HII